MASPDEKAPKQKPAKTSSLRDVSARLLGVGRSVSCRDVLILRTSEGTLALSASPELWADLRVLLMPRTGPATEGTPKPEA